MKTVEILWTGGFDSTYRVCQLSFHEIEIHPYYISPPCNTKRNSENYEVNAIRQITQILANSPRTKCTFAPLVIHHSTDYSSNKTIRETYKKVEQRDRIPSQYNWLAGFALNHVGIELSIHKDDKELEIVEKYCKLRKVSGAS